MESHADQGAIGSSVWIGAASEPGRHLLSVAQRSRCQGTNLSTGDRCDAPSQVRRAGIFLCQNPRLIALSRLFCLKGQKVSLARKRLINRKGWVEKNSICARPMSETISCSVQIKGNNERQTKALQQEQTRFSPLCVLQPNNWIQSESPVKTSRHDYLTHVAAWYWWWKKHHQRTSTSPRGLWNPLNSAWCVTLRFHVFFCNFHDPLHIYQCRGSKS